MKTYRVPHTDMSVSRIAYGCSQLASWDKQPVSSDDIAKAARAIHTAYDNGITLFDNADVYGYGKSEAVLGEVLKQSPGLRNKVIIQSKCGQRFVQGATSVSSIRPDLSREHIVTSVEGSLRRLCTDRLDILLLHIPDPLMRPEEVAEAFDDLSRDGKVRNFGVSNHNSAQIQLLKASVRQPIVVNQIQLSLSHALPLADGMEFTLQAARLDTVEHCHAAVAGVGTIDYCRAHDILLQAWSPLRSVLPSTDSTHEARALSQLIADSARRKQTTPAVIALTWLLQHPARLVPVFSSNVPEHIRENCTAADARLDRDEWYALFLAAAEPRRLARCGTSAP